MSFEQAVVQLEQTNSKLQEEVVRFRDAAMGLNNIYSTITEGRQNTADGKYFSVPGNGAYMRLYRRQGSSAELIAEFPDRAELNSVIDQLGPLLGRDVVGGSGDLMAQGAFGLGSDSGSLAGVLSEITQTGFYRIGSDDPDLPRPTGVARVLHIAGGGGASQFATQLLTIGSGGVNENLYIRSKNSGAWGPFRFIYDSEGILGTVSQSGGVPTGAIIEQGSNVNGKYTKLADGTLFCHHATTIPYLDAARLHGGWDFPHRFVDPTSFSYSISLSSRDPNNVSDGINLGKLKESTPVEGSHDANKLNILIYSATNSYVPDDFAWVYFTAIGRWY